MLSPAGVLSGTSGRQNTTQEWISAKLNCPVSFNMFMGLVMKRECLAGRTNALHKHCMSLSSPLLIDCVCPLVEGKRFNLVLSNLAGFGLKPWRHVSLKGAILTLYRPHLIEKSGQLLKYCLPCNLKKMLMYVIITLKKKSRHKEVDTFSSSLVVFAWHL